MFWALLQYEYLWADGVKYKKPVRLPAPEYIDKLFDWVEAQVGPENLPKSIMD
jgi:MOB kinase activator 1